MAAKRFSMLLGYDEMTKDNNNTVHEEEAFGIEGKRSRFSQLFGTSTEQESIESGYSVLDPEDGGKPFGRFSQLFSGATQSDDISLRGERPIKVKEENDVLTMVFRLFVRSSRQTTKHKRNASTNSFKPAPRKTGVKKGRVKVTVNIRPFWKTRKEGQAVKKDADALSLSPSLSLMPNVVRKPRKDKNRANSVCDSKFSSISSELSFTSLPHELLALTASQCTILLHLTRKVDRSLQNQERLTANFSTNLAFLFARKERIIDGNKRLSKELRKMLLQMMTGLRELVGRTFLKKTVFTQRSLQLVHDLTEILERGTGYKMQAVNASDTTLVPLPQIDAGNRMSIAIEELNGSDLSLANPPCEQLRNIDICHFQHTLQVLREDITVQQQLDAALRAGIVGPCEDLRFPATVNERIAMKRFIAFVDGCLGVLSRRYAQEENVARALDMLGRVLKGEEGV